MCWLKVSASFLHSRGYAVAVYINAFRHQYSTIYALSSGSRKSGVALIRISGNRSSDVIIRMTNLARLPPAKLATLKTIHDAETQEPLDKGILIWFPGPRSFTGEDVCELHVHGSKAVIEAVLRSLSKLKHFRPAEPGEFTKRAFYAGKFDLTEVEGLSDLIDAETEMQRKQALYQMDGSLKLIYLTWRKTILRNLARVEAYIDFSEDENIEENILRDTRNEIEGVQRSIKEHLNDYRKGEILRDGIKTAIIGAPNVGKSSLLNMICRRPASIVTEIAGTTRDVVESTVNINGYPVLLADTAGIRNEDSDDIVEKEGIRRSLNEARFADLILLVVNTIDLFRNVDISTMPNSSIQEVVLSYCDQYMKILRVDCLTSSDKCIIVANKIDLLCDNLKRTLKETMKSKSHFVFVSCKTEEGIAELSSCMSGHFKQLCGMPERKNPSLSRARHRHHLTECSKSIENFLIILKSKKEENIPFAAEELRSVSRHLGMITGVVATEEILSVIFENFCIGK